MEIIVHAIILIIINKPENTCIVVALSKCLTLIIRTCTCNYMYMYMYHASKKEFALCTCNCSAHEV